MATTVDYMEYVAETLSYFPTLRYRKMFGEYMVYINDKPVALVCDGIFYVKKLPEIADLMADASVGLPYEGTKEHYILEIEDRGLAKKVLNIIESVTPLPKPRKPKKAKA